MKNTTHNIAHLARSAGVSFGQHAFVIVQVADIGDMAERAFLCTSKTRDDIKAEAEAYAARRKQNYPSSDFIALEVGAPADGAELIERLASLIEDAMDNHIYDADNGEEPEPDCGYLRAVNEARAFVASRQAFSVPPIGALEIMTDLEGALSSLDHEIDQMKGMFPDDDGNIQQAQEDAAEALHRAKTYRKAVGAGPVHLYVKVEGGNVQDVTCDREVPDLQVTVIDFDVTEEDQVVSEIHMEGDRWATVRADSYPITTEAAPTLRDLPEQED